MDVEDRLRVALSSRYELVRELGRGGMAYVYLAHDRKHDRDVAIKIIRPDLGEHLGSTRFLQEIQITSRLQHPHILPVFDSGDADGLLYYVMPYVQGESLRERLTRELQLPIAEAIDIARDVADALGYAHGHGIVHRDIKPENILLADGHALVADFGIARMMHEARGRRLTDAGVAIGTPAYMSPEQAGGDGGIDGRTDLYALGCVLYEMLAGTPPFSGSSAQAVLARHMREPPPPIHVVRPTVPETVEHALAGLLAKTPADRFATASQFLEATRIEPTSRGRWPRNARRTVGALVGVAAVTTLVLVAPWLRGRSTLDMDGYLVPACESMPGVTALSAEQCGDHLRRAFQRWDSVQVYAPNDVDGAIDGGGAVPLTRDALFRRARTARAGVVVTSELRQAEGMLHLTVTAVDVRTGNQLAKASDSTPIASADSDTWFRGPALATILRRSDVPPISATHSLAAVRTYLAGRDALAAGSLAVAAEHFREAMDLDSKFADAAFGYAEARLWAGDSVESWQGAAGRAMARRDELADPEERRLAEPLAQLASGNFRAACGGFATATRRDSMSVAAWLGLAECLSRDALVVRSSASPSHWAFESSYQRAIDAYRRALGLSRKFSLVIVARAPRLLPTDGGVYLPGVAAAPDTGAFWAYPTLDHDTLAFVPSRAAKAQSGNALVSSGAPDALQRDRELFLAFAKAATEDQPGSLAAQKSYASALEASGRITAALQAIRLARAAAGDRNDSLATAITEVRLLVKAGEFAQAHELADSVLTEWPIPPIALASRVAALAALVGHASRAADLLAMDAASAQAASPDPVVRGLGTDIFRKQQRLLAYAAIGGPADSIVRWRSGIDTLLGSVASPGDRVKVRNTLLDNVMKWAYPTIPVTSVQSPTSEDYLLRWQWLATHGRFASVRAQFASLARTRQGLPPKSLGVAPAYQEALLMVQVGDTAEAERHLDGVLNALPSIQSPTFDFVEQAAALVRAMALRARLAAARHDTATARQWSAAVSKLWSDADPGLQAAPHPTR